MYRSKSALLLSVSVQPFVFLAMPWVEVIATPLLTDGLPPSPLLAVPLPAAPQATQSTNAASCVGVQGVAAAPQALPGMPPALTIPTLPLDPDMLIVVVDASGVTGRGVVPGAALFN